MSLTFEDRIALQDLLTRYAHAIDIGCPEADFIAMFTEDAVLDSPLTGSYQGVDGVKRFRAERLDRLGKVQVRHVITNFQATGDAGQAVVLAYLTQYKTQIDAPAASDRKTNFLYTGSYRCLARKVAGQWKLSERTVYIDGLKDPGSTS